VLPAPRGFAARFSKRLVQKARDLKVAAIFLMVISLPLNSGGFPAAVFYVQLLTND
jgi:hypothetical protein